MPIFTEPITWDYIQKLYQQCLEERIDIPVKLGRDKESQNRYHQDLSQKDPERFFHQLFPDNDQIRFPYRVRLNDFPYYLESGLEHWVIWLHPHQTQYQYHPIIDSTLESDIVEKMNLQIGQYVIYRNTPENRTVPLIPHYHLVIRT